MNTFKNGDLVQLSLHGRMVLGQANITDRIGIVLRERLIFNTVLVKWFTTGGLSETHVDFIEKLEKNT